MSGTSGTGQDLAHEPVAVPVEPPEPWYQRRTVRLFKTFAAPIGAVLVLWMAFEYLRRPNHNRLLVPRS